MRECRRQSLQIAVWLTVLGAVLAVLTTAGPAAPPASPERWARWLGDTPSVEAAFALVRVAALATGWYLAVVTAVGLGVRLVRAPGLAAAADRLTVPPLRRMLAGVGLATVGLAGGVSTFAAPAVAVAATRAQPASTEPSAAPESTVTMRWLPPADAAATPAPAVAEPAPEPPRSWTVGPGECFWSIADQVLARAWDRAPSDGEIVPYWRTLIEANRATLADPANPDLVYPGQTFTVPAPS